MLLSLRSSRLLVVWWSVIFAEKLCGVRGAVVAVGLLAPRTEAEITLRTVNDETLQAAV